MLLFYLPFRMPDQNLSALLWSVADLLRGDYKQSEYGRVVLPFTVLRRLDGVLAPTKAAVLAKKEEGAPALLLKRTAGVGFYNDHRLDLGRALADPDQLLPNLLAYAAAFSEEVRDVFECFEFERQVQRLHDAGLLYQVAEKFAQADLSPEAVSNAEMGTVFEELIRRFAELSNETAGEHFTPREVIRLMVDLLFHEDDDALRRGHAVREIYDPTAGTGGMLSVADEHLRSMNPAASLTMSGQELNRESYAIAKADLLIKGQPVDAMHHGNTLSEDALPGKRFDYLISNPPFGVEWKKIQKEVKAEHKERGFAGRFGPGLPRVSDGSLLFLLHLLSKMRNAAPAGSEDKSGGSRIAIVLNGSPLFTGNAGSGESEIRRHVLENDLLEAIVGLPTDMFYNTGIATYVWVLTNRKAPERRGQVQLIDASAKWRKMRKSLGSKRRELSPAHIEEIVKLHGAAADADDENGKPVSRVFPNDAFGFRTVTVERPERDKNGEPVLGQRGRAKGKPVADASLRDTENVPLGEDLDAWFKREVKPHAPDAWIDPDKTKIGYEIPFNRHFYVFEPPRPLEAIDADLKVVTSKIVEMIEGL